ncbi:MAG: hypothetical protein O8C58_06020 [Candidatus Methanoperedens sp.]|nr:hypothetical protein [Candidatus Methanoperedens sp.]
MKIEGNTIIFKSLPEFFHKEKTGLKCNTIRTFIKVSEFKEFEAFKEAFDKLPNKQIQIINTVTSESFIRRLTDISPFEEHFIFSWREEK